MIKVDNRKFIINLTKNYMKENKKRNFIIILAIALTTILITSVFTVAGVLENSIEMHNFKMAGSDFHGAFKYLSEEQASQLKEDTLIKGYGIRRLLGMGANEEFKKSQVEISYMDEQNAKSYFIKPIEGRLPREKTKEIACDEEVIKMLGIKKNIGEQIHLDIVLGNGQVISDTFTLVGWWKYDKAIFANHCLLANSYIEKALEGYINDEHDFTGKYDLGMYFKNDKSIDESVAKIANNKGYQVEDEKQDKYLYTGVNWGYLSNQMKNKVSLEVIITIVVLIGTIILSGYMIIYNIFYASVLRDIKFYGLLKAIGTTSRQIKRIIYYQALYLSAIGIPIGITFGVLIGNFMSTMISGMLNDIEVIKGINCLYIVMAAVFSIVTVIISARKPGEVARKVSPVEATKYMDTSITIKSKVKVTKNKNILFMALSNLKRSRKKFILSVLSISLAVTLFQGSANLVNGFDEVKYLEQRMVSDFILGKASYFKHSVNTDNIERSLNEEDIEYLENNIDIEKSGRVYVDLNGQIELTEEIFRGLYGGNYNENQEIVDGRVNDPISLYGFNDYLLNKLNIFEGNIDGLKSNDIIAIYSKNDYGIPIEESNIVKLGDKVTITQTGRDDEIDTKKYEVVAKAMIKNPMSLRYTGPLAFAVNEASLFTDSQFVRTMAYVFDTENDIKDEEFLLEYTTVVNPDLNFESKKSMLNEISTLKNIVKIVGIYLSIVLGLIGILNYFNSIITGIIARTRELAVLNAIGMTNSQIKKMLAVEALIYVGISGIVASALTFMINRFGWQNLEEILWFFSAKNSYKYSLYMLSTFVLIGLGISEIGYKILNKKTVIDRLRNM